MSDFIISVAACVAFVYVSVSQTFPGILHIFERTSVLLAGA